MRIFNSAGELVAAPAQPLLLTGALTGVQAHGGPLLPDSGGSASLLLLGTGATYAWDGRDANGQWVQGGTYTLTFTPASGPTYSAAVTVLRQALGGSVDIYNSAGERVRHWTEASGDAGFLALSTGSLAPGGADLKIQWGPGGADAVSWNGRNDLGTAVDPGSYLISVTGASAGGQPVKYVASVQVLALPGSLLALALAAPNPVGPGTANLSVLAPALAAGDGLSAVLYTLVGERVGQAAGRGPRLGLALPPALAGGIYVLVLEARSAATGGIERKVLKLAVAR